MNELKVISQDAKEVFRRCGTCSQTFAHLMDHHFGHTMEMEELATDPLAGGIVNQGHQCGMLWGAAMAVGGEAYRRTDDPERATAVAVSATQHIIESFIAKANTVNCKEIIGYDLTSVLGLVQFMLKTMIKGINNSQCFNFAEEWAPHAIQAGEEGLAAEPMHLTQPPVSCAAEVVKKMGATEEEMAMVAGFAGGLGLSGNACGALSAAIWMKTLNWCRENPSEKPPMFSNKMAKDILKRFRKETNSELLCQEIIGRHFETIDEHSEYINSGGCSKLINALALS